MRKKLLSFLLVGAMAACLTACGTVEKDVEGDWTTDTINGKPVADWAAEKGTNVAGAASNMNVKSGKITVTNSAMSQTYDAEYKSNGFEVKSNGTVVMSIAYDSSAKTLSYKVNVNGEENTYVMKKGTTDLSNPVIPGQEGGEEGGAEGGEEGGAEGGEEGGAEGGAEEGGAEGGEEGAEE